MSHSFYIHDVPNANLRETVAALPYENLVVETQGNEDWPALAHIFQDNVSVRAIETAMEGSTLQVRIMAHSSTDDFALAAAITEQVASKYGKHIESEDSAEDMSVEQWREQYGPEWQQEQCQTYMQMLVGMYKKQDKDSTMRMWGTRSELEVGPRMMEPLLQHSESCYDKFFDRFRRLNYLDQEDVFAANLMAVSQQDTEKQAVFSVLSEDVETALSTKATFVVLNHKGLLQNDIKEGQTILKLTDFIDLAEDKLTWLGDGLAVTPAFQGEDWKNLIEAAQSRATDFFAHPELLSEPQETTQNTEEQNEDGSALNIDATGWDVLSSAPIVIFLLVAAADGEIDVKEIKAFQKKVLEGITAANDNQILAVAMIKAMSVFEERFQQLRGLGGQELAEILGVARHVVAQATDDDTGSQFAQALYNLGEAVAKASGGFLGFGSKISKEERLVLQHLRALLGIN